jgi:hypothetical protein
MILADYLKPHNASILSLLAVVITSTEGMAQAPSVSTAPSSTPKIKKQNVATTEVLKQKISINGLPDYSGKQTFLTGRMHNTPVGPQYQENFIAVEPPTQIVDWYKSALTGYKWEIIDNDGSMMHAKKSDGSSLTVTISPYKGPQGRSFVRISYHDHHAP